jgi:hypothetical protein
LGEWMVSLSLVFVRDPDRYYAALPSTLKKTIKGGNQLIGRVVEI